MTKIDTDPALRGKHESGLDLAGNVDILRDVIRRELPGALRSIIVSGENGTGIINDRAQRIFSLATLFPAGADELTESWNLLADKFDSQEGDQAAVINRKQITGILISVLVIQTTLPPHKKALCLENGSSAEIRLSRALKKTTQHSEATAQKVTQLGRIYDSFISETSEELQTPPVDINQNKRQIVLLDSYARLNNGNLMTFLQVFQSPTLPGSSYFLSRDHAAEPIFKSPFIAGLLRDGELETTSISIKSIIWSWLRRSNPNIPWVMEYFFQRKELQIFYWRSVVEMYEKLDPHVYLHGVKKDADQHVFNMDGSILSAILETLPSEADVRRQLAEIFVVNLGVFKNDFPGHPNISLVMERIKSLIDEVGGDESLSRALAILGDHQPGALALTRNGLITGEHITHAFYISNTPQSEVESAPTVSCKNQDIVVGEGEIKNSALGEALTLDPERVSKLLVHLNHKLGQTTRDSFDLAAEYERLPRGSVDHVVIPGILPSTHPLTDLLRIGVLAVARSDNDIEVIIDPEKTGIKTINKRPLCLQGNLDRHQELIIAGMNEEFAYTPLHLLLKSAALFARAEFIRGLGGRKHTSPYSIAELTQINRVVLSWNIFARENGFPMLGFDENTAGPVVFPLGDTTRIQRAALLTLNLIP